MRFAVLGSGSGGNAVVVESGGEALLIDAGLSAKQLRLRLEILGIRPENLAGIFLTHEHGDHVRGLDVFLRTCPVPVHATVQTARVVGESMKKPPRWVVFEQGREFTCGGFMIGTFRLPHDAVDPVGYVFKKRDRSIAIATDLGHIDDEVRQALTGVHGLVLEANYDDELLENDLKRPFGIKQRIASRHGHLSNAQASAILAELVAAGLEKVILGHLSSDCNRVETALAAVAASCAGIAVCCATQHEPSPWQTIPLAPALPVFAEGGQGFFSFG